MGLPRIEASWCTLAVLSLPIQPAHPQASIEIPNATTCRRCSITATQVRELRDNSGDAGLDEPQAWIRDSRGWSFIATVNNADAFIVGPPGDRPQLRRVGRLGSAPGEFRGVREFAIGAGDSLYVWDGSLLRMNVFAPAPALAYVRSYSLPMEVEPGGYRVLANGRLLINADMARPEALGLPFHLVAPDGKVLKSIGPGGQLFRRGKDREQLSRLFALTDRGWWAIARTTYVLESWDSGGVQSNRYVRRPPWFAPSGLEPITHQTPPGSLVTGVNHLGGGRLLVISIAADQRWKSGLEKSKSVHGDYYKVADYSRVYDTMIEVIDMQTQALVASSRIDAAIVRLLPNGIGMEYTTDKESRPVVREWKISWQPQ